MSELKVVAREGGVVGRIRFRKARTDKLTRCFGLLFTTATEALLLLFHLASTFDRLASSLTIYK